MRNVVTCSCFLLLASTTACELADEPEQGLAPDAGLEEEEEEQETGEEEEGELVLELASVPGTSGKLNLWDDDDFTDTHESRYEYDSDFRNDDFNDKASSIINRTSRYWMLYEHRDYGGFRACIRPYSYVRELGNVEFTYQGYTYNWNDRISSVRRKTTSLSSCNNHRVIGTRY